MKCIIFALTGFGNSVLRGLLTARVFNEIVVVTRKEKGPFPYYCCDHLETYCYEKGVRCFTDKQLSHKSINSIVKEFESDLILTATFDQIIPQSLIKLARIGAVNIHPSLLPDYRGPTPTHWVIINDEKETGITYHRLSSKPDMGPILRSEKLLIGNRTDGQLRKDLADLAERTVVDFCHQFIKGEVDERSQKKDEGSYFPKILSSRGMELLQSGNFNFQNLIRGLTPYPGHNILKVE